jgi:hypothetical protein
MSWGVSNPVPPIPAPGTSNLPSGGNFQRGTRNLSPSDLTRLKRLGGSLQYNNVVLANRDVINPLPVRQPPNGGARYIQVDFGTSKYRRPASYWTNYRASQTADYVTEIYNPETDGNGKVLTVHRLCSCDTTNLPKTDRTICLKCNI